MSEKMYEVTAIKKGKAIIKAANEEEAQGKAENVKNYKWDDKIEIQTVEEVDYQ